MAWQSFMNTPIALPSGGFVAWGEVTQYLCASATSVFAFALVAVGLTAIVRLVYISIGSRHFAAHGRIIETDIGVVAWWDGVQWNELTSEPATVTHQTFNPVGEPPVRLIPVRTHARQSANDYAEEWKRAAFVFYSVATEYGMSKIGFKNAGISDNAYLAGAAQLEKMGLLHLKNPASRRSGWVLPNLKIQDILNHEIWGQTAFTAPPPTGLCVELAESPEYANAN